MVVASGGPTPATPLPGTQLTEDEARSLVERYEALARRSPADSADTDLNEETTGVELHGGPEAWTGRVCFGGRPVFGVIYDRESEDEPGPAGRDPLLVV